MGLLSFTKGELAGFGEGLREDRLLREDREYKDKVRKEDQEAQVELLKTRFGLEQEQAARLNDEIIEKGVNAVYSALGSKLPASARASVYKLLAGKAYTPESFVEAWSSGKIKWNESTKNARYSLGSMEEMSAYWTQLEQEYDLPTGYLATIAEMESASGKKMVNPASSARGLFQFMPDTAEEYGVDVHDWKSSSLGAAKYAANSKKRLQKTLNKQDISGEELYLAHQQGAGGASKLLSRPTAMGVDVVGVDSIQLNVPKDKDGNPVIPIHTSTAQQFSDLYFDKYRKVRQGREQYVNTPLMAGPVAIADRGVDVEEPTGKYGFEVVTVTDDDPDLIQLFKGLTEDNYEGAAVGAEQSGKPELAAKIRAHGDINLRKFNWANVRKENYKALAMAQRKRGGAENIALADQIEQFGDSAFGEEGAFNKSTYQEQYFKALKIVGSPAAQTVEELEWASDWFANVKPFAEQALGLDKKDETALESEIALLQKNLGMSREDATRLATGALRLRTDEVTRETVLIDLTKPNGAPKVVIEGADAENDSLFGASDGLDSLTEEEITELRIAQSYTPEQIQEKFDNIQTSLGKKLAGVDLKSVSGLEGQFNALLNGVTDYLNMASFDEEARVSTQVLKDLEVITEVSLQAAFPSVRDSVYLKKQFSKLPPKGGTGKGLRDNISAIDSMIRLLEDSVFRLKDIDNRRVNPAAKSKANEGLGQIEILLSYYKALQQAVARGSGTPATAADVMKDPNEVVTTTSPNDGQDRVTENGLVYRVVE